MGLLRVFNCGKSAVGKSLCGFPRYAGCIRTPGKVLHLSTVATTYTLDRAHRLARELFDLLHDQLDCLDDTAQDLLNGDGDANRRGKGEGQRCRREVRRAVGGKLVIEEDARRFDSHRDDQKDQHEGDEDPAKRLLERPQDLFANAAEDVNELLLHILLLSLPEPRQS